MANWMDLEEEVIAWNVSGKKPQFWWRDDDAIEVTPALDTLIDLHCTFEIPLVIAVIPGNLNFNLIGCLNERPGITVVQHGFYHINHASQGEKASEYPDVRDIGTMISEVEDGWTRLAAFENLEKVFVPPWNRVGDNLLAELAPAEYSAVSTFGSKTEPRGDRLNAHADIINWRKDRGFAGEEKVMENMLFHLKGKRLGHFDADEPTGILSHHLDHDQGCWSFLEKFFGWSKKQLTIEWMSGAQLFRP